MSRARRQRAAQLRRVRDDGRHRLRRARARAGARGGRAARATPASTSARPATSARATCCASASTANALELVGGFVPMRFSERRALRGGHGGAAPHARPVRRRRRRPARGRCCATPAGPSGSPTPAAAARTRRCGSTTRAGGRSRATSQRAAEAARERGYEPVFHHHTSTYVEGMPEIERLLEDTDVPLLLDSGHLAVAGGDAVAALRDWGERVGAVHIKDVRLDVLETVKAERADTPHRLAARPVLRARRGRRRPRGLLRRARRSAATTAGSSSSRIACSRAPTRSPARPTSRCATASGSASTRGGERGPRRPHDGPDQRRRLPAADRRVAARGRVVRQVPRRQPDQRRGGRRAATAATAP